MSTVTKYFESSRGRVAYSDSGSGSPALILMHGLPTSKELFSPVLPLLNRRFRLIAFDLNDYGESEKMAQVMNHRIRADVLEELRLHLRLKKFVLVAHDLGSSVAIDYMGRHGRFVQKFVIMSPPVYPDFVEPPIIKLVRVPYLGELLVYLLKDFLFSFGIRSGLYNKDNYTPDLQAAMSGAFDGKAGRAALLRNLRWGRPHDFFREYPRIIRGITVPTLILQGFVDPYIPHSQVFRLRDDIAGAELVFFERAAHFLPIDVPERVAAEINRFVGARA